MKKLIVMLILLLIIPNKVLAFSITDEAFLHLNKSYQYATEGPNTFDCSGFTFYCYKKIYNIELPRTAKEQGYNEKFTTIENIMELEEGDLVFFNTNKSDHDLCDHAGIYIGKGYVIHSSSSKGKITISSLVNGYYHERFSWGKRIGGKQYGTYYGKTRFSGQYNYIRALL